MTELNLGPLLEPEQSETLETHDREHSGPGGEPDCPLCSTGMIRLVETYPGPRSDDSPFRVRLVCAAEDCRAWTVYDW